VNNRVYYQVGSKPTALNLDTPIMPERDFLTRTMQSGSVYKQDKGIKAQTTLVSAVS
jgi:hypothetical protein